MRMKKLITMGMALCIFLSLTGCNVSQESEIQETEGSAEIVKDDSANIHIRDNDLLYKDHDPAEVVTMYLTVSTGNASENTDHTWKEVNTYSVYDYENMGVDRYKVAGLLQVGDENGPISGELGYGQLSPNCTVQIRGQTSSRAAQKNYKISIKDNKGDWNGQTTIALNKHVYEGLRFRNKLCYDLMAGIEEMMGLRTTFVHLYVKDTTEGGNGKFVDYGLYTQVEQLNKTALEAHGLNKNGHLYKINEFDFSRYEDTIVLADSPSYDLKAFETLLEVKGDNDHTKLIEMLEAVNDITISSDEVLDRYFDVENLSYWMAFHILMGNKDTQSRNVYIYSPLNSDRWYFYSWDNDGALRDYEYKLQGRVDIDSWDTGIGNYWGNALFQRVLKSEKFRAALDAAIEDLYDYLNPERIGSMASTYSEIVKPYVFREPDSIYLPVTQAQYDQVAANLIMEIEENYKEYYASYEKPMPFYIGVPAKTEDGKLSYVWDAAFDFDAETITYTFELDRDYLFSDPIIKQEDILIPGITGDMLSPGQYFVRIRATNQSGLSQYAFDTYIIDSGKVYGIKCFYVMEDGTIVEDVYVEG